MTNILAQVFIKLGDIFHVDPMFLIDNLRVVTNYSVGV